MIFPLRVLGSHETIWIVSGFAIGQIPLVTSAVIAFLSISGSFSGLIETTKA